jgi:hypothetical protein
MGQHSRQYYMNISRQLHAHFALTPVKEFQVPTEQET